MIRTYLIRIFKRMIFYFTLCFLYVSFGLSPELWLNWVHTTYLWKGRESQQLQEDPTRETDNCYPAVYPPRNFFEGNGLLIVSSKPTPPPKKKKRKKRYI